MGFNDNSVMLGQLEPEQAAKINADVGANVTRWTVDWRWIETTPGTYRFERYDEMYRAALARGIRPILILLHSPYWTWEPGVACDQFREECAYPPGRLHDADWERFARAVAERYPEAAAIEVWNEPNLHWFWESGADPVRYSELLRLAHRAVKSVNRSMPVIAGGFSTTDVTANGDMAIADYLRVVYERSGRRYFDALGIHPYPVEPNFGEGSFFARSLATVRGLRDRHDPGKPLWITETGLTRTDPDPRRRVSEEQQADGLVTLLRMFRGMDDVDVVIFHTLLETGTDPWNSESGYGIMDRYQNPRPAYCALARELGGPYRCPSSVLNPGQYSARDAAAQETLRAADAAAVRYAGANGDSFAGLSSAELHSLDARLSPLDPASEHPGDGADPARIGVYVVSSTYVVLCNAADTAFCIARSLGPGGLVHYDSSPVSLYAAAIAVQHEQRASW